MGTVVALAGQVGAAKLADGLYRLRGKDLAVIVNTGDDYEHLGLRFSPDLDTMLYTLAGIASPAAGWEPEGESHAVHGMLKSLGGPEWPQLGDRSLAAPLLRSDGLANDRRLTQITLDFCRGLGVAARILPMSDDAVRGMKELLRKRGAPVIAVTPIVGGKAPKGSAGKMMRELGREPTVRSVAG